MIIWFCVILPVFHVFFRYLVSIFVLLFVLLFSTQKKNHLLLLHALLLRFCLFLCFFRFQIHKIPHTVCPKTKTNFPFACVFVWLCCYRCLFKWVCVCPINIAITSIPTSFHCVCMFACVLFCLYCECVCVHSPTVQCKQFSVFILLLEPLFEAAAIDCHVQCMLASTSISFIQTSIS